MSGHEGKRQAPRPGNVALASIEMELRRLGYEVEPERQGAPRGSELIARRNLGNRAILLTVDQAGRFRIDLTRQTGEWPSRENFGGTPVRVVESVTRAVSIAGHVEEAERLLEVVAELGRIVPWAEAVNDDGTTTSDVEPAAEFPPPP